MSVATTNSPTAPFSNPAAASDVSEAEIYQTVSRAAVLSAIMAIAGLLSLLAIGLLAFPIAGIFFGFLALVNIRKYPAELIGKSIAKFGIIANVSLLVIAPAYHTYVYLTEVPEGYERVAFASLMSGTGQPDIPTEDALALNGKEIFIKGYIHPSSMSSAESKKFVLVPDLGTCCFGGQPPLTHMIEVTLTGDQTVRQSMRKLRLAGTLKVNRQLKPIEELQGVFYQLKADYLK